jgi:hypothetical protein
MLEEPGDEARQALAEATTAFEEWRAGRGVVVAGLFAARQAEAEALVLLVNGDGQ